jgi:hypothetical protein
MDESELRSELAATRDRSYNAMHRITTHEETCALRYGALVKRLDLLFWIVCAMGILQVFGVRGFDILKELLPILH